MPSSFALNLPIGGGERIFTGTTESIVIACPNPSQETGDQADKRGARRPRLPISRKRTMAANLLNPAETPRFRTSRPANVNREHATREGVGNY